MEIAILGHHSSKGYSGGRYHGWVLAEALASANANVTVYTNNLPEFYNDFSAYPNHNQIKVVVDNTYFDRTPDHKFDFVIVIPHLENSQMFLLKCRIFAARASAKLALINFESPNWFNKYVESPRKASLWRGWLEATADNCLIISSANESTVYAKEYYRKHPNKTFFASAYPAINALAADESGAVEKDNSILIITRFSDAHKGAKDFMGLICPELSGMTLKVIVGVSAPPNNLIQEITEKARQYNITFKIIYRPNDIEKFREIKKSRLVVFPSYFEGFGYPPVEARYCNVRCVAYDLPVLREVNGEDILYAERGNLEDLKRVVLHALEEKNPNINIHAITTVPVFGANVVEALNAYAGNYPMDTSFSKLELNLINKLRLEKLFYSVKTINFKSSSKKLIKRFGKNLRLRYAKYLPHSAKKPLKRVLSNAFLKKIFY